MRELLQNLNIVQSWRTHPFNHVHMLLSLSRVLETVCEKCWKVVHFCYFPAGGNVLFERTNVLHVPLQIGSAWHLEPG